MSKNKRKDPYYSREKRKYGTPIPSREFILQALTDYGKPAVLATIIQMLELEEEAEQEALGYRLKAMLRDGQLMQDRRGRFCLLGHLNLQCGTIQGHSEGYGFFIPEDGSEDMLLSPREMQKVMHGDRVLAYQVGFDRRSRPEGKVHEVLEHANSTVVGRFFIEQGVGFVIPDNKHLTQDISIPIELANGAQDGQMVLAQLVAFPSKRNQAIGKIIHILGEHMAPGMETDVSLLAYGIPCQWPEAVLEEVAQLSQTVLLQEIKGRTDLRHLPFVTIDGKDAKDFDDAVHCQCLPKGGFKLYVAIADVSHYVRPGSELDKEALKRGNSVYFPGRVIPMLPEALSNGICSLNPNVDRLCMVAELRISANGKITRSKFYRAVFCSKARLTYTQVNQWLIDKKAPEAYSELLPHLEALYALYQVLFAARKARGALEFNTTETAIEFDEHHKIKQIVPVYRNEAHRLIEECMLSANIATARFLEKAQLPTLYRVHLPPTEEKMKALRLFLGEFGFKLGGGKAPHPKDFLKTLEGIKHDAERHLIEMVMLRSLKQAHYQEENNGHFGLAYAVYTHFTSPIRRYPDLLVHRALGHLMDGKDMECFAYTQEEMAQMGQHCSVTERRADEASREVIAWLKCEYMQDKLGQVFDGTISGVTGFGIFVALNDIYVEGLVHITALKNDYYHFDAIKHRLLGERTGQQYHLGDKITVQVARVDLDERKIDFEPWIGEE